MIQKLLFDFKSITLYLVKINSEMWKNGKRNMWKLMLFQERYSTVC